jgi:uncharacterized membrane protein YqgA involved in biofilm formation
LLYPVAIAIVGVAVNGVVHAAARACGDGEQQVALVVAVGLFARFPGVDGRRQDAGQATVVIVVATGGTIGRVCGGDEVVGNAKSRVYL